MYPPSVSEPIMKTCLNLITKPSSAQPTVINACDLFKHPQRASRPDHFVVILRGLPGLCFSFLTFYQSCMASWYSFFYQSDLKENITKKFTVILNTIETEFYHVSINYT